MQDRLDRLKHSHHDDIDALAGQMQDQDCSVEDSIGTFGADMKARISVDIGGSILQALDPVEKLSDFALVKMLRETYEIETYDPGRFSTKAPLITKINHGFWEHLAILHTRPERRGSYRDVNLALRQKQYLSSDFLPVLLGSWTTLTVENEVGGFISAITGIRDFAGTLGRPWVAPDSQEVQNYELPSFRRGAVRGLLAFADVLKKSAETAEKKPCFYDSVAINTGFQDGTLLGGISGAATPGTVALIMGPPRLGEVRIADWLGPQAFLAISLQSAMAQWMFNLRNLSAVLESYAAQGRDVVVFFQGAVLGPILAAYVRSLSARLPINVGFVDLGRLMDLAFEQDVTKTGSPLPDGSFDSRGQLNRAEAAGTIFAELSG